ncbi:MAG: hypothetical protein GEU99_17095 [Luteitalea sp.]|nr:hypothetical protein [Luteitalea sp.]
MTSKRVVWHNGGNGYFFADFRRYVDDDVVLAFMANEARNEAVEQEIVRIVFGGERRLTDARERGDHAPRLAPEEMLAQVDRSSSRTPASPFDRLTAP